ncbi:MULTISPECIES: DUF4652 domain-containing protein [Clostridium]|uniref:DUF4652 domain-containing protein n=2 Tax=Clostridium TaxID=1485 RepID=A0A151AMJ4_9CLOT|nr:MULTISPECIES: DUF4652 domain-containing protein [Clostridium]KYH28856.1 hypothetical protein CLCOL_15880 [Clostridium colicanis DSM 13634]MBE6043264.1 DUF4652 domain-containing protein [Clostridium thermopalmarium]PRR70104.1 hypothetical protein CPAL_23250 [Clostridium thermopalmarium DSM 5974]PVZ23119.1 uncharacterized protein DUF4652 [Clostridium thermopalmarium DSM 5974]
MKTSINKLKNNICYIICVLLAALVIGFTGCSSGQIQENKNVTSNSADKKNTKETEENKGKKDESADIDKNKDAENNDDSNKDSSSENTIKFSKNDLGKEVNPKFSTEWKDSLNKKLSICIEGKGPDAIEEGIGKIYVKDLETGEKWSLDIIQKEEQNSPKFVEWLDDENVAVIIGHGYGTIAVGGDLYKLNVKTCEVKEIYKSNTLNQQVTSVKKVNDKLELQLLVYDDDDFIKSHTEKKIIDLK